MQEVERVSIQFALDDNIWAMELGAFQRLAPLWGRESGLVRPGMYSRSPRRNGRPRSSVRSSPHRGPVAVVDIVGPISQRAARFWSTTSVEEVTNQFDAAVEDSEIGSVLLVVDSPGGTLAGIEILANRIYSARTVKPIWSVVNELGASAAYWLAAQANRLIMSCQTAIVGSVGAFMTVADFSKAFMDAGVNLHVIRSGKHKGAGSTGVAIDPEHLAHFQSIVDGVAAVFLRDVQRGRSLSHVQVEAISDGRVFLAKEAMALGLADGVGTERDCLAELERLYGDE